MIIARITFILSRLLGKIHGGKVKMANDVSVEERKSGVELLKIFAIILIIVSHITQSLHSENNYVRYSDYIVNIASATNNIQLIILQFMRHFGMIGNTIFFVCSAWFLLSSNRVNTRKWFLMVLDIWIISVIIAIIHLIAFHGNISTKLLIRCFLPTTFANNWYMTCYLLFYPIHLFLNKLINIMGKKPHLRITLSMFVLYFVLDFIKGGLFFISQLIVWITIYFTISYMKK